MDKLKVNLENHKTNKKNNNNQQIEQLKENHWTIDFIYCYFVTKFPFLKTTTTESIQTISISDKQTFKTKLTLVRFVAITNLSFKFK